MRRQEKGFTLIEMMIVVALIAILAAVALPAYNQYIDRSNLRTAQADLVALSLNLENRFQRTLSYPTLALATNADVQRAFQGWQPASRTFTFGVTSNTAAATYSLTATGNAGGVLNCLVTLSNAAANNRTIANCRYATAGWL